MHFAAQNRFSCGCVLPSVLPTAAGLLRRCAECTDHHRPLRFPNSIHHSSRIHNVNTALLGRLGWNVWTELVRLWRDLIFWSVSGNLPRPCTGFCNLGCALVPGPLQPALIYATQRPMVKRLPNDEASIATRNPAIRTERATTLYRACACALPGRGYS